MEKDFDAWNTLKNDLNRRVVHPNMQFREKDLWVCFVGANIGVEQDGQGPDFLRPVLIFKIFNAEMFWGIPITTRFHETGNYFRFNLGGADQFAILNQIRLFSTKRLQRFIVSMSSELFEEVFVRFEAILSQKQIPLSGNIVTEGIPSRGEFADL